MRLNVGGWLIKYSQRGERKNRRGPTVSIADVSRIGVMEYFVKLLESDNQYSELISILQYILGVEASAGAVC